jgi:hypothetical protein
MASDLISYLMQDKVAEWEQKEAKLQEENAALHATVQAGQHAIEGILIARFPDGPLAVMHDIRRITNPDYLQALIGLLVTAATLDEARRLLADAAAANGA